MALRLLEIAVPSEYEEKISTLFRKHRSVSNWQAAIITRFISMDLFVSS
jgi:hypothetical protein